MSHAATRVPLLLFLSILQVSLVRADGDDAFTPNFKPSLTIAPREGAIVIDGDLDDPGWRNAVVAGNFVETSPRDLVAPPVQTEVRVTFDEDNFYVAFIAADDPTLVRASLRDRDEIFQDDYVGIILDTFGDQSWAYELFCNPLGLQGDLRMMNDGNEDIGFDIIWRSEGKITDDGFQVEVAVPFSSLRFPDNEEQVWRINFWRDRKRAFRERSAWAAIARDDPCFLCQFGTLRGIRGKMSSKKIEALPSFVASQFGRRVDGDDPDSGFDFEDPKGDFGIGLRYSPGPSLSVEAAINPDFSQVESDAAQIDVNTQSALFFPERRPFFQRGSNLFSSWINVIYTRTINDPLLSGKLTARRGNTSVLYLSAWDEHSPYILPFEEFSYEDILAGESLSNILRARHGFAGGSHVGGMFTDRRMRDGGSNSVGGLDYRWRINQNFQVEMQGVVSRTVEPDDTSMTAGLVEFADEQGWSRRFDGGEYTLDFDGEDFWGHAVYASLERNGRVWSMDLDLNQFSPAFRAENGFLTFSNRREVNFWTGWDLRREGDVLENVFPMIMTGGVWNFEDRRKDSWLIGEVSLNLTRQTYIELHQMWSRESYRDVDFDGIRRSQLEVSSSFSDPVQFGGEVSYSRTIARFGDPPFLGKQLLLSAWGNLKPTQRFIIQPNYTWVRMKHPDDDSEVFRGYILRTRFKYQFTRQLFLRFVVQWNEFSENVDFEPLLSYRVNPFTVFYAGATSRLHDYPGGHDLRETERQYFLKAQYQFQR